LCKVHTRIAFLQFLVRCQFTPLLVCRVFPPPHLLTPRFMNSPSFYPALLTDGKCFAFPFLSISRAGGNPYHEPIFLWASPPRLVLFHPGAFSTCLLPLRQLRSSRNVLRHFIFFAGPSSFLCISLIFFCTFLLIPARRTVTAFDLSLLPLVVSPCRERHASPCFFTFQYFFPFFYEAFLFTPARKQLVVFLKPPGSPGTFLVCV